MASILEVLKNPTFRYPTKDPDTYLDFASANSDRVTIGTQFWMGDLSKQYTLSCWVKPKDALIQYPISAQRTNGNVGDGYIKIDTNLFPSFVINRDDVDPFVSTFLSASPCVLNRWNHIVMLFDTINNNITFVVNGVEDSQTLSWSYGEVITQFDTWDLGHHQNNIWGDQYSNMDLANVRIYEDYLLSVEEAQAQYLRGINDYGHSDEVGLTASYHLNEGTGTVATDSKVENQNHGTLTGTATQEDRWITSAPRSYRESVLHDAPKAYWRMKDTKLPNVRDETGNYVGLQHFNAPTINQVGPFPGTKSVEYTAASGHYSQMLQVVLAEDGVNAVSAYTGEMWIKAVSIPATAFYLMDQNDGISSGSGGEFNFGINLRTDLTLNHDEFPPSGAGLNSGDKLTIDVWHHLVWTKDTAGSIQEIYIDGVLVASNATPSNDGTMAVMTQVSIGDDVGSLYLDGSLSEMAIYDYKLSATQAYDHWIAAVNTRTYEQWVLESDPNYWYRFNDVGSPAVTAVNSTTNPISEGRDATWVGTTDINTPGLINDGTPAADFDGTTTYLTLGNTGYGDITTQDFAIECWIRTTGSATAETMTIVDKRSNSAPSQGFGVTIDTSGFVNMYIKDTGSNIRTVDGTIDVTDGLPHHIVANFKRPVTGDAELWIDGVLDASSALTSGTLSNTNELQIGDGGLTGTSWENFNGTMDEWAQYQNRALTSGEIRAHYLRGVRSLNYRESVLADNPYIYFPLDEASGTSPAQIGSSPATGTHTNVTPGVPALHSGSDYAARYNGTDAQTNFVVHGSLSSDSVWTVELFAMVLESSRSSYVTFWHSGNNQPTNQGGYQVILTNAGEISVSGYASSAWRLVTTTGFGFNDFTTYSVTVTCDTTAQKMRFYKNGVFQEEIAWTWGVAQTTGTYNWRIGVQSQDAPGFWFPGDIDSVSYYDGRILSDARIAAHYESGAPLHADRTYNSLVLDAAPVAYYRHESSALGIDSTSNNNNAHTVTDVTEVSGQVGGAGTYNGSTSQMLVADAPSIRDLALSGSYTVEAWVFKTSNSTTQMICDKTDLLTTGGFQVWIDTAGKLNIRRFYTTNSDIRVSTDVVPLSQWVHIVAVMRSDLGGRFYINGVNSAPVTTQNGSGGTNIDDQLDLAIGDRIHGSSLPWSGQLDEVAIYNRELTADEALLHYNVGK